MWEIGNDVARIMFLARLPTVFLGMLLTAVAGRWAKEVTRSHWAGLLAMLLLAFDPNILAHSQLATTDLGLTASCLVGRILAVAILATKPSWAAAGIWAGVGFGLLQNTKFTAGLFVPLFSLVILVAVVGLWRENGRFPTKPLLQFIIAYPLSRLFDIVGRLWVSGGNIAGQFAHIPSIERFDFAIVASFGAAAGYWRAAAKKHALVFVGPIQRQWLVDLFSGCFSVENAAADIVFVGMDGGCPFSAPSAA